MLNNYIAITRHLLIRSEEFFNARRGRWRNHWDAIILIMMAATLAGVASVSDTKQCQWLP